MRQCSLVKDKLPKPCPDVLEAPLYLSVLGNKPKTFNNLTQFLEEQSVPNKLDPQN